MSINMDGGGVEYADHEVQVVTAANTIEGDGNEDGLASDYIHNFQPVSDRGIDSDELAQLVGFYRTATLRIKDSDEGNQSQVADVNAESQLGINIGPAEIASRVSDVGEVVTDDGATIVVNDQDDGELQFANLNEPGILDATRLVAGPAAKDDGEGIGGYMTGPSERDYEFTDLLGSGPYVDRTDDISLHVEVETNNFSGDVDAIFELTYILYWSVEEMPEGRASFARP